MSFLSDLTARARGFIMMSIAAIMLITAICIAWSGVNRWLALSSLKTYKLAVLQGETDNAESAAKSAARRLPKRAATVLPSVDLTGPEGLERLDRLRHFAPPEDRGLINTAIAFAQAVQKKSPGEDFPENSDAVLIRWLDALNKGGTPKKTELSKEDPPHFQTLAYVLQRHFQAGYAAGDIGMIRESAGPLTLLCPRHPNINQLRFITAACDVSYQTADLRVCVERIPTVEERVSLVRLMMQLVPEHRTELLPLIPPELRSGDESQAALLTAQESLDKTVGNALNSPTEQVLRSLSARCLGSGRVDLAKQLADKAASPLREELLMNIAAYEGDLAAMAKLSGQKPDFQPQITEPLVRHNMVTFHLATPSGLIPRAGSLQILLGGIRLGGDQITRFGSLFIIDVSDQPPGTISMEVQLDQQLVFSGTVHL